jgi:hypothetical protein
MCIPPPAHTPLEPSTLLIEQHTTLPCSPIVKCNLIFIITIVHIPRDEQTVQCTSVLELVDKILHSHLEYLHVLIKQLLTIDMPAKVWAKTYISSP